MSRRRVRMTVVFEFDYLVHKLGAEQIDRLATNFLDHPTEFLHPSELEIDETLLVHFEDITEE
jgi:hypothetical protein